MTTIETFLKSKPNDIFIDIDNMNEYNKNDLDEAFQYEQMDGSVTIQEYYEILINFLKGFRKSKTKEVET